MSIEVLTEESRVVAVALPERIQVGELTFSRHGEKQVIFNHTYVSPSYRGDDIAKRMLKAAVEQMRQEGRKIIPQCSYVARVFSHDANYADVLVQ